MTSEDEAATTGDVSSAEFERARLAAFEAEQRALQQSREQAKKKQDAEEAFAEIIQVVKEFDGIGVSLWNVFVSTASDYEDPAFLELMNSVSKVTKQNLRDSLLKKGVLVESRRSLTLSKAIETCFMAEEAPLISIAELAALEECFDATRKARFRVQLPRKEKADRNASANNAGANNAGGDNGNRLDETRAEREEENGNKEEVHDADATSARAEGGRSKKPPDDPDPADSDSDDEKKKKHPKDRMSSIPSDRGISAKDPSMGISMFTKLYQHSSSRYSGDPDESFAIFRETLLRNVVASKVSREEAASVIHVTLRDAALHVFMLKNFDPFETIEEAVNALSTLFEDAAASDRAYLKYMLTGFDEFRRRPECQSLSEAEQVKLFYSSMLSWQIQLGDDYRTDTHIRGRLILVFSQYSPIVKETFAVRRPKTAHSTIQNILQRCSYDKNENLLNPVVTANEVFSTADANVLAANNKALQYRFQGNSSGTRNGSKSRSSNFLQDGISRGKQTKQTRRGSCWVCGDKTHFAYEKHSRQEIQDARQRGKNVHAYVQDLDPLEQVSVLQAELQFLQNLDDGEDECGDDQDSVSQVCMAVSLDNESDVKIDADVFNRETVQRNENVAFVAAMLHKGGVRSGARLARKVFSDRDQSFKSPTFGGIILDTVCTGASVIGAREYAAYCKATNSLYRIDSSRSGRVNFGNVITKNGVTQGAKRSLGIATIRGYIPEFDETLSFEAHVVENVDTGCLMSLNDMDKLKLDFRTGDRTLWSVDKSVPAQDMAKQEFTRGPAKLAVDCFGRGIIQWAYDTQALLSYSELATFHKKYGHASTESVIRSLKEAKYDDLGADTKTKLQDVARNCRTCQMNQVKPRHFSVSVRHRNGMFNHRILVDLAHLIDGECVHILDAASRLQAARFPSVKRNPTAEECWDLIRQAWVDVYVGPPDIIQMDQGSNLIASHIQSACAINGIKFESVPVEAPWRMGLIERAHASLRLAYNKIRADLPAASRDFVLQSAVKAVNDAVGSSGISPTFCVFGQSSRQVPLLNKSLTAVHYDRYRAIRSAQKLVEEYGAAQAAKRAQKFSVERTPDSFAVGDEVIVYRKEEGWTGPFRVKEVTSADVEIIGTNKNSTFEKSQVRLFFPHLTSLRLT